MNWKTILPIGLVVAVVFVGTLISQYTPNKSEENVTGPTVKVPLFFETEQIVYDPNSKSRPSRFAETFYQKSNEPVTQTFWFYNTNMVPIRLKVGGRSCISCTTTRVSTVAQPDWQEFVRTSALGLISGGFGQTDLMSAVAFAQLDSHLQWKELNFDQPDTYAEIPAAANDKSPTMGLFQMVVTPNHDGFKGIEVTLDAGTDGEYTQTRNLRYGVIVVPPCIVTPDTIDIGIRPDNAEPFFTEVYYWSPTESIAQLPPPPISVEENDPFIVVGPLEPLDQEGRRQLVQELDRQKTITRVKSAYRVPITIYRSRPKDASTNVPYEPDIGKFSRRISFAGPNQTTVMTTITGRNVGLIDLVRTDAVEFGTFASQYGSEAKVQIVSDRKDLELIPLPKENSPAALISELSPPRTESGRRYWNLTVKIRPNEYVGQLPGSSRVVLQAKTQDGTQRIYIEVKGQGTAR